MRTPDLFPTLGLAARRLVIWMLIGLAPLQALAASVTSTLGPSHFHVARTSVLVLEDFRRAPAMLAAPPRHIAVAFGHFHSVEVPQRHHHAAGAAGVVVLGGDLVQHGADADESSFSPASASFVALIPSLVVWMPATRSHVAATSAQWAPQTHHPDLPERPPRFG